MKLAELEDAFAAFATGRALEPPAALAELDADRLRLYRRLVLNTVRGPLESGFPYTRRAVGTSAWEALRWAFYEAHPPQAWELNAIVAELPTFLRDVWMADHPDLPPWTADVADYERHELTTYLAPDRPWQGEPAVNPALTLRTYAWDVPGWVKETEGRMTGEPRRRTVQTAMYRDPETLLVRFLEVNPLTAAVIQMLTAGHSLTDIADRLAEGLGIERAACAFQLDALVADLRGRGVVR